MCGQCVVLNKFLLCACVNVFNLYMVKTCSRWWQMYSYMEFAVYIETLYTVLTDRINGIICLRNWTAKEDFGRQECGEK